jgi:hypothetical protein
MLGSELTSVDPEICFGFFVSILNPNTRRMGHNLLMCVFLFVYVSVSHMYVCAHLITKGVSGSLLARRGQEGDSGGANGERRDGFGLI